MKPLDSTLRALEARKREMKDGQQYWKGREIHAVLGYPEWAKFEPVIERAMAACSNTGVDANNHFSRTSNKVSVGSGAMVKRGDYFLSRYACYLIAMNADSKKPEIATAQTYFAVQTRRQEIGDQLTLDQENFAARSLERCNHRFEPGRKTLGRSIIRIVPRCRLSWSVRYGIGRSKSAQKNCFQPMNYSTAQAALN